MFAQQTMQGILLQAPRGKGDSGRRRTHRRTLHILALIGFFLLNKKNIPSVFGKLVDHRKLLSLQAETFRFLQSLGRLVKSETWDPKGPEVQDQVGCMDLGGSYPKLSTQQDSLAWGKVEPNCRTAKLRTQRQHGRTRKDGQCCSGTSSP